MSIKNVQTGKECKFYIDGVEVGSAIILTSDNEPKQVNTKLSFKLTMSEKEQALMRWEVDRPERIRKYIKQIFRNET